jgi:hypothetical protein
MVDNIIKRVIGYRKRWDDHIDGMSRERDSRI